MARAMTAATRKRELLGSVAIWFAATAVVLPLVAGALRSALDLSQAFVVKTLLVFFGGSLLFLPLLLQGHPHPRFGAANQVTLLRGMLVALLAGFLAESVTPAAAWVIVGTGVLALVMDGFDGRLARRSGMTSTFGARFDMETDAAFVLLCSVLAWQLDKAGLWVVLSGLWRYLFVGAGYVLPWMRAELPPSRRRQTVCVIQIAVMLAVLLPFVNSPWSDLLAGITLVLLTLSFAVDVAWLARRRTR